MMEETAERLEATIPDAPAAPVEPAAPAAFTWSPEVLAFAREVGVAEYLDPLLQATQELFPGLRLRVFVEQDPEIWNMRHITWEIDLPYPGTEPYLTSQNRWVKALCQVCPAPLTGYFLLLLLPVSHGPA
jgi:hypothetical protein